MTTLRFNRMSTKFLDRSRLFRKDKPHLTKIGGSLLLTWYTTLRSLSSQLGPVYLYFMLPDNLTLLHPHRSLRLSKDYSSTNNQ